ncbi:MAG: hypothetical protein EP330_19890 [Deltaproteobacteria bacterium]|nr:MAG: hypothetical protein EP330_19890 [Deltaproteobacteria bacterium]
MYRHFTLLLVAGMLPACKLATEPRLVSIDPDYAYTDGCTDVTISGARLGTEATASIGGNPIEGWAAAEEDPTRGEHAQDVGFKYYGVSPANYEAGGTFVDVDLTIDDVTLTLDRGFYYLACPGDFMVEAIGVGETNVVGDAIGVFGCGIDEAEVTGGLYSVTDFTQVASFDIVSDCRGAITHFEVPDVADGTYLVYMTHSNGGSGGMLCDPSDTGLDTATVCAPTYITIDSSGGAR